MSRHNISRFPVRDHVQVAFNGPIKLMLTKSWEQKLESDFTTISYDHPFLRRIANVTSRRNTLWENTLNILMVASQIKAQFRRLKMCDRLQNLIINVCYELGIKSLHHIKHLLFNFLNYLTSNVLMKVHFCIYGNSKNATT